MLKKSAMMLPFLLMVAQAEDVFGAMFAATSNNMQNVALTSLVGNAVDTPATPTSNSKPTLITFKPDARTSAALQKEILKALLQAAPDKEKELTQMLQQANPVGNLRKAIQQMGHDPNELAVSLTLWVNVSFGQLREQDSTDQEDAAVLQQFRSAVGKTPAFQKLSNTERQKASELLMYLTFFQTMDYMGAQQQKEGHDMDAIKAFIRSNLLRFELDPDKITLTEQGLTSLQ